MRRGVKMRARITPSKRRLWHVKHPYYCNLNNFFSGECRETFDSWAEFFAAEGDSDYDMNLVFRWDWVGKRTNLHDGLSSTPTLDLFFMGQRKGLFRSVSIKIASEDEPAARAWLIDRGRYLLKLWSPLVAEMVSA